MLTPMTIDAALKRAGKPTHQQTVHVPGTHDLIRTWKSISVQRAETIASPTKKRWADLEERTKKYRLQFRAQCVEPVLASLQSAGITAGRVDTRDIVHEAFYNAVEHGPDGGDIEIEQIASSEAALLRVTQDGEGIRNLAALEKKARKLRFTRDIDMDDYRRSLIRCILQDLDPRDPRIFAGGMEQRGNGLLAYELTKHEVWFHRENQRFSLFALFDAQHKKRLQDDEQGDQNTDGKRL